MIFIYSIYSIFVALSTLLFSLIFVILGWWFLFIPRNKRLGFFNYVVAYPWIFFVLRLLLWVRLKIIGRENVDPKRTTLYICNHQSWFDIPVVFRYTTKALFVSKKQVRRLPLVGVLIIYSGRALIFDRSDIKARLSIIKKLMGAFKQGNSIILFPEGTRSRDGKLLRPNKAILKLCYKLNIPVVPLAIEGTRNMLPRNRFYLKFFQKVIVEYNQPIYKDKYSTDEEFANACWDKVKETHQKILNMN